MATFIIVLVIIATLGGLFWVMRCQPASVRARYKAPAVTGKPSRLGGIDKLQASELFWGVEIGQPGCDAARAGMGRQYRMEDAPELPLPGCDAAMCTCQFKGLREQRRGQRRTGEDRRTDIRFDKDHPDRRTKRGRRRGDKWTDHTL